MFFSTNLFDRDFKAAGFSVEYLGVRMYGPVSTVVNAYLRHPDTERPFLVRFEVFEDGVAALKPGSDSVELVRFLFSHTDDEFLLFYRMRGIYHMLLSVIKLLLVGAFWKAVILYQSGYSLGLIPVILCLLGLCIGIPLCFRWVRQLY